MVRRIFQENRVAGLFWRGCGWVVTSVLFHRVYYSWAGNDPRHAGDSVHTTAVGINHIIENVRRFHNGAISKIVYVATEPNRERENTLQQIKSQTMTSSLLQGRFLNVQRVIVLWYGLIYSWGVLYTPEYILVWAVFLLYELMPATARTLCLRTSALWFSIVGKWYWARVVGREYKKSRTTDLLMKHLTF